MTLSTVLTEIVEFILDPVLAILTALGIDASLISIKLGFGSVTWFDIPLDDLLSIAVTLLVWFMAYKGLWKFLKYLWPFKKKKVG